MPRSVDTVLTINPDGTISADFTGHISAQGIDMLAGTATSPPSDRRIRWHKDTLNGGVVADIYAYSSGITSGDTSFVTLEATQVGAEGTELLLGTQLAGGLASYVDIVSGPQATFGPAKVMARASDPTATSDVVTIIDSNGRSTFGRTRIRGGQTAVDTLTTIGVGTYTPMTHGPSITVGAGQYLFSASGEIRNSAAAANDIRVALIKGGNAAILYAFMGWLFATAPQQAIMTGTTVNGLVACSAGDVFSLAVATSNLQATFGDLNGWVLQAERISA